MDIQWVFHLAFESPKIGNVMDIQLAAAVFQSAFLGDNVDHHHLETLAAVDFLVANRLHLLLDFFEIH